MSSLLRCGIRLGVAACFLLPSNLRSFSEQTTAVEKQKFNHDIRCTVQTELQRWTRNTEAIISGTVENLTDGPLELEVDPSLYLSSRTSQELGDSFWAPVDLLRDRPADIDSHDDGPGVSIVPRPIRLHFNNKGDKIDFRIDAKHLLWDKEISSGWPSFALFSVVKSGDYDLQLILESDQGRVESQKVRLSIDATKRPKQ